LFFEVFKEFGLLPIFPASLPVRLRHLPFSIFHLPNFPPRPGEKKDKKMAKMLSQ